MFNTIKETLFVCHDNTCWLLPNFYWIEIWRYVDVSTVDAETSKLINERITRTGASFLEVLLFFRWIMSRLIKDWWFWFFKGKNVIILHSRNINKKRMRIFSHDYTILIGSSFWLQEASRGWAIDISYGRWV